MVAARVVVGHFEQSVHLRPLCPGVVYASNDSMTGTATGGPTVGSSSMSVPTGSPPTSAICAS